MPEEDRTKHNRIALTVYAVVRLHRAHMNNQQRRVRAMTYDVAPEAAAAEAIKPILLDMNWQARMEEEPGTLSEWARKISGAAFAVFEKAHAPHAPTEAQIDAAAKVIVGEHFDILSDESLRNIWETAGNVLRAAGAVGQEGEGDG